MWKRENEVWVSALGSRSISYTTCRCYLHESQKIPYGANLYQSFPQRYKFSRSSSHGSLLHSSISFFMGKIGQTEQGWLCSIMDLLAFGELPTKFRKLLEQHQAQDWYRTHWLQVTPWKSLNFSCQNSQTGDPNSHVTALTWEGSFFKNRPSIFPLSPDVCYRDTTRPSTARRSEFEACYLYRYSSPWLCHKALTAPTIQQLTSLTHRQPGWLKVIHINKCLWTIKFLFFFFLLIWGHKRIIQ